MRKTILEAVVGSTVHGTAVKDGLEDLDLMAVVLEDQKTFAGFNANVTFHNLFLGLAMLLGRFGYIIPILAIAGSLAGKTPAAATAGTFPTHGPVFVTLLVATILIVGALTFLPVLALGPIAEHVSVLAGRAF